MRKLLALLTALLFLAGSAQADPSDFDALIQRRQAVVSEREAVKKAESDFYDALVTAAKNPTTANKAALDVKYEAFKTRNSLRRTTNARRKP